MNINRENFQADFFLRLSRRFESRAEMVSEIGEILHVGRDAVYRRLRGDTVLSAQELINLSRHYQIKLDDGKTDRPQMYYPAGSGMKISNEKDHFLSLERQISLAKTIPGARVDYATPELPLFYELYSPTLLAYKTYLFGLTTWDFGKWKGKNFSMDLIDPEIYEIAARSMKIAYSFPSRELWSVDILDVTLRRIEHGVQTGYLNNQSLVETMFSEIEAILQHMEDMVRVGKRFVPSEKPTKESPDFRVYHNELSNTNSVIIVDSKLQSIVFSTLIAPNYLVTYDERIVNQMKLWFSNLLETANVLSADSAKYTAAYFHNLRRKIHNTKHRIEVMNVR
jgi:hypothetical protein